MYLRIRVVSHACAGRRLGSAFSRSFARGFSCCRVSRFAHDASADARAWFLPRCIFVNRFHWDEKERGRHQTFGDARSSMVNRERRPLTLEQSRKGTAAVDRVRWTRSSRNALERSKTHASALDSSAAKPLGIRVAKTRLTLNLKVGNMQLSFLHTCTHTHSRV